MRTLVIGNRNYSSWSLRAWLYVNASNIACEIERIPMFTPDWLEQVLSFSPAARVPVWCDGAVRVWDSMAIIEHLRHTQDSALGWPDDEAKAAHARSISFEMHSGFLALRGELPQNLRLRQKVPMSALSPDARSQVGRVLQIWADCRQRYGAHGPWLFGELSIADIVFAPVALRFRTYSIPVEGAAAEYSLAVEEWQAVQEWCALAEAEEEQIAFIDQLVPAAESPLVLG